MTNTAEYAELLKWLREKVEDQFIAADGYQTTMTYMLSDAAEALSTLLAREERLKEALKPFAAIEPSSFYAPDGSEGESYNVSVTGKQGSTPCDFTAFDLANARAALNGEPQ